MYENWFLPNPDEPFFECTELWAGYGYTGQWMDWLCAFDGPAFCQFYPNGRPEPEKPVLPAKAGCKPGWWPYAGYCYLLMGYTENIWNQDDFQQYTTANTTCGMEWSGAMLARVFEFFDFRYFYL